MNDCSNEQNEDIPSTLFKSSILNKCVNRHQEAGHQTVIIKNLEKSLKHNQAPTADESLPNYYEWSLCDVNSAHIHIFNQISSRRLQLLHTAANSQLESLSYFNCKKLGQFSLMYDRLIHGDYIYSQQQFGTSRMRKPHPMRDSIPCEETFRWIPVRSSSMVGRRAHLPLDLFGTTAIATNKKLFDS